MALIKCPECYREISDKAEACPSCGYKFEPKQLEITSKLIKEYNRQVTAKPINISIWWLPFTLIVIIIIFWTGYNSSKPGSAPAEQVKSAEELRMERVKKEFSAWDGSHIKLTELIKQSMNDPNSFEFDSIVVNKDGGDYLILTEKFRGKNAFGGVMPSWVKAKVDLDGNILEIIAEGP